MAKDKQAPNAAQPETDERVRRSREVVLATTQQLLSETGLGGVSVDEVSRRSGVAKTTIYRHWPSRSALLLDACSVLASKSEAGDLPDTGSLSGDALALALDLAHRLRSARWPSVLPSIIDAAERDPEIAELHKRLHASYMLPFQTLIERAQRRGELPRRRKASEVVAAIAGPLFYRRWFSREPIDERFVKNVVEAALVSITGR